MSDRSHFGDELLADYDAGLLDPDAVDRVDVHLSTCGDCGDRLAAIRRVGALLAAQPAPAMPADVFDRLHRSVTALVDRDPGNADFPDDPGTLRIDPEVGRGYADERPAPVRSDRPSGVPDDLLENRALGARTTAANPGWARPTMGSLEQTVSRRRRPARIVIGVLATGALAAAVGFGGFLISAVSGHNEPAADHPLVVESGQLGSSAGVGDRSGLSAHRFSDAWNCARQVTSGRITGIRASVLNDRPGFLVFLDGPGDTTRVVFVSGCGTTPSAGPSTVLPRR